MGAILETTPRGSGRWLGACALAGLLCLPRTAGAQTTFHATASATAAYSDNAFSARTDPLPGDDPPIETAFLLVDPGLLLLHESVRSQYSAAYNHTFSFYREASDRNTGRDVLALRGAFELTPRDRLTGLLQATQTSFALLVLDSTRPGGDQVTTGGNDEVVETNAAEIWRRELSETWRSIQRWEFGLVVPLSAQSGDDPRFRSGLSLGVENARERDAHGFLVRGTYFASFLDGTSEDRRYVPRAEYTWRHDFSPLLNSDLSAGVAAELAPGADPITVFAGDAALNFLDARFQGSVRVSREPSAELLAQQVFLRDQAELNAEYSLDERGHFRLNASASVGRNRGFQQDQGSSESVNVVRADGGVNWFGPGFSVGLGYEYFNQFGAQQNAALLGDIKRRVVQLTVGGTFPSRRVEPINVDLPTRVDGADQLPPGTSTAEPTAE